MIYLKDILNEYINIYSSNEINNAKNKKLSIYLIWNNGDISTDVKDLMKNTFQFYSFFIDFSKNSIKISLLDDRSDFAHIKKIQQAIKDFKRLKYITDDWDFYIQSLKSSKINLGGIKVKNLLNYNSDFDKYIPKAFHGTSDYYLENINKFGIVPNKHVDSINNWNSGNSIDSDDNIYLTIDYSKAVYYAKHTVKTLKDQLRINSKPIVVEIKDLPTDNIKIDDDMSLNTDFSRFLNYIQTGKQKTDYISSIRINSQFAYKGRISKNFIKKIYKNI